MFSYEYLMLRIALPDEAVTAVYPALDALRGKRNELTDAFFGGLDISESVRFTSDESGINIDTVWLAVVIILSERTLCMYNTRKLSEELFYDTMEDIRIWTLRSRRDFGTWGIHSEFGWLSNHLRATLFRLGRLQFETVDFDRDEYSSGATVISRGDRVINIHVPDDGRPLTRELRYDSYKKASSFFGLDCFICRSWLLYPEHKKFLRPDSNVLDFMRDFDIVDFGTEKPSDNMWRVFGYHEIYDPKRLPRDTGMRRAYADWLASGGMPGWGYGIMV